MGKIAVDRRIRRRINKRRFAATLGVLFIIAVIGFALALFTDDFLAKSAKPADAEIPQASKSKPPAEETKPVKETAGKGNLRFFVL